MERLKNFLSDIDKDLLVKRLSNSDYAFASWRMPQSNESHLIVSLSSSNQMSTSLSELEKGFIINRFDDSHPIQPHCIKADLIIGKELHIDPKVGAEQLESFEQVIKSESASIEKNYLKVKEATSDEFELMIQTAVNEISKGVFDKVVLSRLKNIVLPDNFSALSFFENLCDSYPGAFCSLVHLPNEGVWVGATPELLISDNRDRFKTNSLAGTKKLQNGQPLSEIAWTQKEIEEQAFVSRYIINCFKKIRLREFHELGPRTIKAGNLAHLKTEFTVDYSEIQFEGLADQMLGLLHPTSAVCGMPLEPARNFVRESESHKRSFYSGFLGPVNFNESTDLYVNLRCMNILGTEARLYAGAGITQDSNPEKEMLETELKMDTLLSVIKKLDAPSSSL